MFEENELSKMRAKKIQQMLDGSKPKVPIVKDPIILTDGNFSVEVSVHKLLIVDFWAPWCGPCRMVSPVVDEIAGEVADNVKVGKINVDEQPELASQFGVMSIPTLIVMKNGKVASTSVGAKSKQAILGML